MEFVNKITGYVLALVLGAILVGGLLIPTVEGIQTNVGDSVKLNNPIKIDSPPYEIWGGEDITLAYDNSTGTYTVNGVSQSWGADTQRIIIASNDFAARNGGVLPDYQLQTQYVTLTTQVINKSFEFEIINKEYTLTLDGNEYTGDVDWLVYAMDNGSANLGQLTQAGTAGFYTSTTDDIIVLGNIYTTGDNDTFYSYYKGELTVNSTYADVSSVDITKTLKSGYTDIYDTTITVNVGEESFTPYYILAPKTVSGHETAGTYYVMFGVISLLGIIMLVVVAANAIRVKY